jgi:tetratricopeptide (TPR) repeat protein
MNMGMPMDERESFLPIPKRNSLGYYPPARALIVRGTGRYHNYGSLKLEVGMGGGQAAAPKPGNNGGLAGNNNPGANPAGNAGNAAVNNRVAFPNGPIAVGNDAKPQLIDAKTDPELMAKKLDKDPRRMWQQAVDWTVTDPGVIVASAEFLIEMKEPAHAVELLKAGLRKGLTTDEWAHEALAVALQMTQANPAEAERAALSGIDLDLTNAQAYIRAAKVEADLKNHDYAFALCQRAAFIAPDRPEVYANALVYAEAAKDVKSDAVAWAADNLLKRDWSNADGIDYHQKAREHVDAMVKKFDIAGIKADALKRTQIEQTRRDIVIELLWQGTADLDLSVTEPSGSVCSSTQKRTTGGGLLKADTFNLKVDGDNSEEYIAASAFSGTYKIGVKQAFGRAIGGTATIKVTKFKGTPNQVHDLITVDLMNPKPIEIKLDGGSRTELATVSDDPNEFLRADTTAAPVTTQASGFGGGVGTAGKTLTGQVEEANGPRLPVVVKGREQVLPGLGGAADIRAQYKLNPDRKTYSVTVNPVFATSKGAIVMPKLQLLPGSEPASR